MLCKAAWASRSHLLHVAAVACILLVTTATTDACSHRAEGHGLEPAEASAGHLAEAAVAKATTEPDWILYEDYSTSNSLATARLLLSTSRAESNATTTAFAPHASKTSNNSSHQQQQQQQQQQSVDRPGPRCGARNITALEHTSIAFKLSKSRLSAARLARLVDKPGTMSIASVQQQQQRSLTVGVYFHVISGATSDSAVNAPPHLLAQQLAVMNSAYGRWSIRFDLKGVTRVQSDSWALTEINSDQETAMKNRLRRGGPSDLNIYFIRPSSGTLGWSTFPWEMSKLGQAFDGVVVHVGTLPGGTMAPYNKGFTLVHEVGHWLGLLHVFENGCGSPGDSVDDTPPQASAAYGCPMDRHTCAGLTRDPVTNYMGYTDDACMTGFTRGQADRILDLWGVYRGVPDDGAVTESGAASGTAGQTQQQQPKLPGTGLGMLLPVLFRRNIGQTDASAVNISVVTAAVNQDSASLYGSAIPRDPAAVFAQQQAAVAAAMGGQTSPTPDSSQSSPSAAPQYQLQQQGQYTGSYAAPAMSQQQQQQQQQQGTLQGYYYATPIPATMSGAAAYTPINTPSFTSTYRPYSAAQAALPATFGSSSSPVAVTTAQQAMQAPVWTSSQQQQSVSGATGGSSFSGYSQGGQGYDSFAHATSTVSPTPMYIQVRPGSSSSSNSGTSSDQWQSALSAAMGTQQTSGWTSPGSSTSGSSVGVSGSSSSAATTDTDLSGWLDASQLNRKMGGSGIANRLGPLKLLRG